ncbi:MAG: hypothetical protein HPAVJP_0410 [Candidatus Hepatoplasma vulgare]|nr:MAG: hypothetical protein HPAVJP_0410 [Candidatus Hepatoplasma sp.]
MSKDYLKVINDLMELKFFNKKNSEFFVFSFLNEKQKYEEIFSKNLERLKKLKFCSKCNLISDLEKCDNCNLKSEEIYIFEDFSDYYSLASKIENVEKSFILNIYKKTDYLDKNKLNDLILKIEGLINENKITKKIIFMISPSFESQILKEILRKKLNKKIIFNEIPLGIPLNSKIKYYDANLLKELIEKNE